MMKLMPEMDARDGCLALLVVVALVVAALLPDLLLLTKSASKRGSRVT
jgi:hypothetical protein